MTKEASTGPVSAGSAQPIIAPDVAQQTMDAKLQAAIAAMDQSRAESPAPAEPSQPITEAPGNGEPAEPAPVAAPPEPVAGKAPDAPSGAPKVDVAALLSQDRQVSLQKREEAKAKAQPSYEELLQKAKESPDEILNHYGLSEQEIAIKWLMKSGDDEQAPAPVADEALPKAVAERIERLEQNQMKIEEHRATEEMRTQAQAIMADAKGFIDQNKEKYEILANSSSGAQKLVDVLFSHYEENKSYYDQHNTYPTYSDVADDVEAHLLSELKGQAEWMSKQGKLRPVIADFLGKQAQPVPGRSSSLNNGLGTDQPTITKGLSPDEKVELAIQRLEASRQQG